MLPRRAAGWAALWLCWLWQAAASGPAEGEEEEGGCQELLSRCTVRMACGMALHNYRISCRSELYGRASDCSEKCQQASISLASTSEGYDYMHCDCGLNLFCHTLRNRTSSCWTSPLFQDQQQGNGSSVQETSCRVAEWMCTADEVCLVAWDYFRQLCRSLFAGVECSRRCNNSLSILMRQRHAQSLHDCVCDGPDADACFQERTNIRRLCYGLRDDDASSSSSLLRHFLPLFLLFFLLRGLTSGPC